MVLGQGSAVDALQVAWVGDGFRLEPLDDLLVCLARLPCLVHPRRRPLELRLELSDPGGIGARVRREVVSVDKGSGAVANRVDLSLHLRALVVGRVVPQPHLRDLPPQGLAW